MGLFDRFETVFAKKGSEAENQLLQMKELVASGAPINRAKVEKDIKLLEAGVYGERQIVFELENSRLPLVVLQDLRLEHEGLSSQIDFLVITPYVNLVIECKNLFGNISVNGQGEWIREFNYGYGPKKEGVYSPITQNERHLQLMQAIKSADSGILGRFATERWFRDFYRSVVVLANHKTVFSASKRFRETAVRADGLVERINKLNAECRDNGKSSFKDMEESAQYWLSKHVDRPVDVVAKYAAAQDDFASPACPLCGSPMVLREAKKGPKAGRGFYGCSMFPKCRGIVNL